jgi:hypothetical protein
MIGSMMVALVFALSVLAIGVGISGCCLILLGILSGGGKDE